MELRVTVTDASLDDVVGVVYDRFEETVTDTTLGDEIIRQVMGRLAADPRWEGLAARFWDAADEYLRETAPEAVKQLAEREVARQLADTAQGAMTRGAKSTRAEAIVATEVTAQLRAQFTPVVERALAGLRRDLEIEAAAAVAQFREGLAKS